MINEPKTTEDLYLQLISTTGLCGNISYISDSIITWELHGNLVLCIFIENGEGYIDVNNGLFHWHPGTDEIYMMLCDIGKEGHILVIRNTFLWSEIFYIGPAVCYRFTPRKKWYWGKLYYFGS